MDLSALDLQVSSGLVNRYLKSEIDALLTTINTNINLKVPTTTYTTGLATKLDLITGMLSNGLVNNGSNNRAVISNSSGKLATSGIQTLELYF